LKIYWRIGVNLSIFFCLGLGISDNCIWLGSAFSQPVLKSNLNPTRNSPNKSNSKLAQKPDSPKLDTKSDPKTESATKLLERGTAHIRLGNLPQAIATFRLAIQKDPKLTAAYYNLGLALAQTRQLPQAIAAFETVIKLDSQFSLAHSNLGAALLQSGKIDPAIESLERAIKVSDRPLQSRTGISHQKRLVWRNSLPSPCFTTFT
jgi:tetratricopeptide (TPR) repeat protein